MISAGRVLVTGASRGIGRATADAILARGGRVIAVARDASKLEALRAEAPDRVHVLAADLSDTVRLANVIRESIKPFDGFDGLVNCAGVAIYERVGAISVEAAEAQVRVNLLAPLFLAQEAAKHIPEGGAVVNVSSTLAVRVAPTTAVYAATKAGLDSITKTLAVELAPTKIRVNAVLPGVVDTDMIRAPRDESGDTTVSAQLESLRALHPLARLGHPEEIAAVILGLLDHPWQTGSLVTVDGGLSVA